MKQRIEWLDTSKGIGIILVILAHLNVGKIGTLIYSFHIPLFFILSGYVFNNKNQFKIFLKKKIKNILIPYFSLGFILICFDFFIRYEFNLTNFLNVLIKLLLQQRYLTIWFLSCLFFVNLLFYFISKKNAKTIIMFNILFIVLGLFYFKFFNFDFFWNIDLSLMVLPFFTVGYFFKEYNIIEDIIFKNKLKYLIIFGLGNFIIAFVCNRYFSSGLNICENNFGIVPFSYLSAICGSICIIIVSKIIDLKFIKYIGKNSILYFSLHQTLFIPFSNLILSNFALNKVTFIFLQFCLIIILCSVTSILFNNSKLKFLIGKF